MDAAGLDLNQTCDKPARSNFNFQPQESLLSATEERESFSTRVGLKHVPLIGWKMTRCVLHV